ncbi:methyl-accepting chemotaxis protein [Alteribacillus sp. YIM 98480]|uniref:methyl-accepting chemotaxis protein n=1 Tax=Alteribacillus sp. YIM 98480 TaxID=2606599 RepID=UPI00131B8C2C|nr:methyl-accepting chemotaxis protein [Alteribacillus sp. YIM 98480]
MFIFKNKKYHHQVNNHLKKVADGDLSFQLSDVASAKDYQSTNGILRKTVSGLKNVIRIVRNSAATVNERVTDISNRSKNIAGSIHTVTETMNELTDGIQQSANESAKIAEEMHSVHQFAEDVVEKNHEVMQANKSVAQAVTRGRESVKESVVVMNKLEEESKNNEEGMQRLSYSSDEISTILKMIKDIAEQTNLLSLNANIEAARAGSYGKGFSVVAGEVGKLAIQSKQATEKIEHLIGGLLEEVNQTSKRTTSVLELVQMGVDSITNSSSSFDSIENELSNIEGQIENMNDAGKKLSKSTAVITDSLNHNSAIIEEISAGSQDVLGSAQEQQANIEEMHASILDTTQHTNTLTAVISQFKLPNVSQLHKYQKEIEMFLEQALTIRGIMVNMINCTDMEEISKWNKKKKETEKQLYNTIQQLKNFSLSPIDQQYLTDLEKAWNTFSEIKDNNAKLMIKGEFEQARKNLVNKGRASFKEVTNTITSWLDQ